LLGNSHADAIKNVLAEAANVHRISTYFWVRNNPLMNTKEEISEVGDEIKSKEISTVVLHYSPGAVSPVVVQEFVGRMTLAGITVVIVGPVPTWKVNVPEAMWSPTKQNLLGLDQNYTQYSLSNAEEINSLKSLVKPGVNYVDLGSILCKPKCRYADAKGVPYYWDSGHLTLSGASLLRTALDDVVSKFVKSSDAR
jgi:hypothetical protein